MKGRTKKNKWRMGERDYSPENSEGIGEWTVYLNKLQIICL